MTYDIARWDGKTYKVDLPEETTEIAGVIVSGDEILVWPTYCDPWGGREGGGLLRRRVAQDPQDGNWVEE